MKILKYNTYLFLNEEYSDFSQMAFGQPFTNQTFASDKYFNIGNPDSPYTDYYSQNRGMVNSMMDLTKKIALTTTMNFDQVKDDLFLEDIENYTDLKILRMNRNDKGTLDLFISYCYGGEEFYGIYKDYNNQFQKSVLRTELVSDPRYRFDEQYMMKLDNYIYGLLEKWFKPKKGNYKSLDSTQVKDSFGRQFVLKINSIINCEGWNVDENGQPYVVLKYKDIEYTISGNNYYWFNYRFQKI